MIRKSSKYQFQERESDSWAWACQVTQVLKTIVVWISFTLTYIPPCLSLRLPCYCRHYSRKVNLTFQSTFLWESRKTWSSNHSLPSEDALWESLSQWYPKPRILPWETWGCVHNELSMREVFSSQSVSIIRSLPYYTRRQRVQVERKKSFTLKIIQVCCAGFWAWT